jgi:hypothetical protein
MAEITNETVENKKPKVTHVTYISSSVAKTLTNYLQTNEATIFSKKRNVDITDEFIELISFKKEKKEAKNKVLQSIVDDDEPKHLVIDDDTSKADESTLVLAKPPIIVRRVKKEKAITVEGKVVKSKSDKSKSDKSKSDKSKSDKSEKTDKLCEAILPSGEKCVKRKRNDQFCGTHSKASQPSTPAEDGTELKKVEVWVQCIHGINYYIDATNNVYRPEDVIANKVKPEVIAQWVLNDAKEYTIPSLGLM